MTRATNDDHRRPTEAQQARSEIDRQRRLIDQMLTGHSLLRDANRAKATAMACTLLAASVVATAFAFAAGGAQVTILGLSAERSTWLGWFAVGTFSVTLIDLVINWRGHARKHEDAVRQLGVLKSEYRTPPDLGAEVAERDRLSQRYQAVMDALPNIPERKFLKLKAKHLQKVELSRILSAKPGMTVWRARSELRRRVAE